MYCLDVINECVSFWCSVAQSCLTLCDPMGCSMPGFPVHHQLPEVTQTHVHWVSDAIWHLILCRPLLLLPSVFASIRVFSNESVLHIRWPKYWNFNFSISPAVNIQDWFPLGLTGCISLQSKELLSLLQHHNSKASVLRCSAFFTVQLSHPYMTTGKAIALTRQTFVGKVISLLFNMLSRLVITFLPRSKRLLISWLQHSSSNLWNDHHDKSSNHLSPYKVITELLIIFSTV